MTPRFADWLATLEAERKNASDPAGWIGLGVLALVLMSVAGWVPWTRELFGLRFSAAVACFAPALVVGVCGGLLERHDRLSLPAYALLMLLGSSLLQFALAAWVSLSELPGAALMALFFYACTCFHGHHHRVTLRFPYGAFGTLIALAGAIALDTSAENLAVFALLGPATLGSSLLFGHIGLQSHHARQEQASLRAAVQAQVLQEHVRDRDRLSSRVLQLLEHNHDASNALSSAYLYAQTLAEVVREGEPSPQERAEVADLAKRVDSGLSRLRDLLEKVREVRDDERALPQEVRVAPVLREELEHVRDRFPRIEIRSPLGDDDFEGLRVLLVGGDMSLHRVLGNVFLNACQGDGVRRAARIHVRIEREPEGRRVRLICHDDGPGFPRSILAAPPTAFQTTKPNGTGLGLYTASGLLAASGGALELANAQSGGAVVTLVLPLSSVS